MLSAEIRKRDTFPGTGASDTDWLAVSTDGFAQQNAGREPAHLVKELLQNSLDAIDDRPGEIRLTFTADRDGVSISCADDGNGVLDLDNIRTVFWTSKQDSHLNRGRMGRGFKEMLCLAKSASVFSRNGTIHFQIKSGKRVIQRDTEQFSGTRVEMKMPWDADVIEGLVAYFETFLVPANVKLIVNNGEIIHRGAKHIVSGTLTTEAFRDGRWVKPQFKTELHLVPTQKNETSQIYEMGIPVCDTEWDRPYHINVMQRVPMNPNRDAAATGYAAKLHKACLPALIAEMEPDDLRQEWIGAVAPALEENVQKEIIDKGWGDNVVRSVPKMGTRRDHDADARELGKETVNTQHLSEGFRKIISKHVPTSMEAVQSFESARVQEAAMSAFAVEEAYQETEVAAQQRKLIEEAGGREKVETVVSFALWFCNCLLKIYPDATCSGVKVGPLRTGDNMRFGKTAVATWSGSNELTLGLDSPGIWAEPLGAWALEVFIHEAAHNRAMHHGAAFNHEVETLAGVAANVMFRNADKIRQKWPSLV